MPSFSLAKVRALAHIDLPFQLVQSLYLTVYSQPENIMLLKPKSKKIKLIDFGLSRKLREDEIVKEMMGTPEFVGESNTALVHAPMCSVTTNTRLQRADFFSRNH